MDSPIEQVSSGTEEEETEILITVKQEGQTEDEDIHIISQRHGDTESKRETDDNETSNHEEEDGYDEGITVDSAEDMENELISPTESIEATDKTPVIADDAYTTQGVDQQSQSGGSTPKKRIEYTNSDMSSEVTNAVHQDTVFTTQLSESTQEFMTDQPIKESLSAPKPGIGKKKKKKKSRKSKSQPKRTKSIPIPPSELTLDEKIKKDINEKIKVQKIKQEWKQEQEMKYNEILEKDNQEEQRLMNQQYLRMQKACEKRLLLQKKVAAVETNRQQILNQQKQNLDRAMSKIESAQRRKEEYLREREERIMAQAAERWLKKKFADQQAMQNQRKKDFVLQKTIAREEAQTKKINDLKMQRMRQDQIRKQAITNFLLYNQSNVV